MSGRNHKETAVVKSVFGDQPHIQLLIVYISVPFYQWGNADRPNMGCHSRRKSGQTETIPGIWTLQQPWLPLLQELALGLMFYPVASLAGVIALTTYAERGALVELYPLFIAPMASRRSHPRTIRDPMGRGVFARSNL